MTFITLISYIFFGQEEVITFAFFSHRLQHKRRTVTVLSGALTPSVSQTGKAGHVYTLNIAKLKVLDEVGFLLLMLQLVYKFIIFYWGRVEYSLVNTII